jgi:hypothetical protein
MDYVKIYNDIIGRALFEKRVKGNGVYYELHHITPRCMGGGNNKENMVLLTAREHFIVHKMLPTMFPKYRKELSLALHRMAFSTTTKMNRDYHIGAREFERIRQEIGDAISGENNPFANKKHTDESLSVMRKRAKERFSNPENHPMYGKSLSKEVIEKIRIRNTGRKASEETRKKMSKQRAGRPKSREHVINQANAHRGKKRTEETKEKLRGPKPKYVCEHCGQTIGGMSNLHQHLVKKHNIPVGKWGKLINQ